MTIHTTEKGRIFLTPAEGCWLTNNATYSPGPVYLGKFDTPENWHDVETHDGYEWRQNEDGVWELVPIETEEIEEDETDE